MPEYHCFQVAGMTPPGETMRQVTLFFQIEHDMVILSLDGEPVFMADWTTRFLPALERMLTTIQTEEGSELE